MRFFLVLFLFAVSSFANENSVKFFLFCESKTLMGATSLYRFNNAEGLVKHGRSPSLLGDPYEEETVNETIYSLIAYDDKTYEFEARVNSRNYSQNYPNQRLIIDRSSLDLSSWHGSFNSFNESCQLLSEEEYWRLAPKRPKNKI